MTGCHRRSLRGDTRHATFAATCSRSSRYTSARRHAVGHPDIPGHKQRTAGAGDRFNPGDDVHRLHHTVGRAVCTGTARQSQGDRLAGARSRGAGARARRQPPSRPAAPTRVHELRTPITRPDGSDRDDAASTHADGAARRKAGPRGARCRREGVGDRRARARRAVGAAQSDRDGIL